MSDQGAIPLGLAQQKAAKNIDPEQLESMGKRAAARFGEGGCSLSEAVVEIVKEARLAPEQVKRVCEFANTSAYLQEFEKSGEQRNVTFDGGPADPSYVLKELNDGSSPAIHQVKTAAIIDSKELWGSTKYRAYDHILAEAFGTSESLSKEASMVVEHDHATRALPGEELADLKIRLEGMRDDFKSKYASSGVLLHDVRSDLCNTVQQEVMGGTPMTDIARAWYGTADAPIVKEAMKMVVGHLQTVGMQKEASWNLGGPVPQRVVNPEHPVVERFVALTKISHEHRKLEHALDIVKEQLEDVNAKLRSL
jgi:hypothetical protein